MQHKQLTTVNFKQLTTGSLFRIGWIANLAVWGVIAVILAVLALLGYDTVEFNDQPLHGIGAVIGAIVIGGVFALIGAVLMMLGGMLAKFAGRWLTFGDLDILTEATEEGGEDQP